MLFYNGWIHVITQQINPLLIQRRICHLRTNQCSNNNTNFIMSSNMLLKWPSVKKSNYYSNTIAIWLQYGCNKITATGQPTIIPTIQPTEALTNMPTDHPSIELLASCADNNNIIVHRKDSTESTIKL